MTESKLMILKKGAAIALLFIFTIFMADPAENKPADFELPKEARTAASLNICSNIRIRQSDIFDIQTNKAAIEKLEEINIPGFFKSAEIKKSYVYLIRPFTLPDNFADKKTFLELKGTRGELQVFMNNKPVFKKRCYDEDFHINISGELKRDKSENELIIVFNTPDYEKSSFGLKEMNITVPPDVHHAFNDASSDSSGIFINAEEINFMTKTANIKISGSLVNDATGDRTINYSGTLINLSNNSKTEISNTEITLKPGEVYNLNIEKKAAEIDLWSCGRPCLYKYYSVIKLGGETVDAEETTTGFKKLEYIYNREENRTGLYLNRQFIFLTGFNYSYGRDWQLPDIPAIPADYSTGMIRDANANVIRLTDEFIDDSVVSSCGRNGILIICMVKNEDDFKALIKKYKNSPSLVFFEIGGKNITLEKINKFRDAAGSACPGFKPFLGAVTPASAVSSGLDWIGTKSGRYYNEDTEKSKPVFEINNLDYYCCDNGGNIKVPGTNKIFLDASTYAKLLVNEYGRFLSRSTNPAVPGKRIWSGLILNTFNDYETDDGETNCSGIVSALKIKKGLYNIYKILQGGFDKKYGIEIVNSWNCNEGETVDLTVISNCDIVKLYVNNKAVKTNRTPVNGYLFRFENIPWQKGSVRAEGYRNFRKICTAEKRTFEKPGGIKLTYETLPGGMEEGSPEAIIINAEITDADGERCLSYNDAIEMAVEGPCKVAVKIMKNLSLVKDNIYSLRLSSGISRIIIQPDKASGIIKIKASGIDLDPAELNMELKN